MRHRASLRFPPAAALVAGFLWTAGAAVAAPGEAARSADDATEDRREMVVMTRVEGDGEPVTLTRVRGGGYLGVELTPLSPELRAHFGVPEDRGVLVARVREDSPAERSGVQVGDVVTALEGEAVESPWDLGVAVRRHEAGEDVVLEVWRDGRPLDFQATVEERDRERVDLSRFLQGPDGGVQKAIRLRHRLEAGELPEIYFDPESMERLKESIESIDWSRVRAPLAQRNRELERRLEALESRLRELETALEEKRPEER